MTAPNDNVPSVDKMIQLLSALSDGWLDESQRQELLDLLRRDPEARAALVEHAILDSLLFSRTRRSPSLLREEDDAEMNEVVGRRQDAPSPMELLVSPSSSVPFPSIVIDPLSTVQRSVFSLNAPVGSMLFSYAMSVLFVCMGMLIGWTWKVSDLHLVVKTEAAPAPINDSMPRPSPKMVFVGRITGLIDCQFSNDKDILPPPSSYAHVPLGRKYKLDSGLMEITYDTGAKVILQGPVTYEVESAAGGFLSIGKLTAKVEQKREGGRGRMENSPLPSSLPLFFVRTPTAIVTDLGTEFGVECEKSGTTFSHVFRGSVKMKLTSEDGKASGQEVILVENESGCVEKTGGQPAAIRRVPEKSTSYVRMMPVSKRVTESSAYSKLVFSLLPAVYYRMEHPKTEQDKLKVFDSAPGAHSGTLYLANEFGQPWVPGRFGDALFFRGPEVGDHVIVPDYPKALNDCLTVSAWVMTESRSFFGMIAANWGGEDHPEPNITGQFHFGLFGQDGDLAIEMTQHNGESIRLREGASQPLPIGIWQHVAFVADGKTLRLYRNGVEVASMPSEGVIPQPPMKSLAIGCKTNDSGKELSPNVPAYWHGRIDELAIFNDALSAETIRKLSETPKKETVSVEPKQRK